MNDIYNVLIDIHPAISGFAGIPQEARLLFKTLAEKQASISATGLIYGHGQEMLKYQFRKCKQDEKQMIQHSNFLMDLLGKNPANDDGLGRLGKLVNHLKRKLKDYYALRRLPFHYSFDTKAIDKDQFYDFIWRVFFSKTLCADDFELLKKQTYFISNLNLKSMRFCAMLHRNAKLNTQGMDFAIFQLPRPVQVSPGTISLVRYHDSIPLRDMDVASPGSNASHGQDLLQSMNHSFYVCNSEPTRQELIKISPKLVTKSATIPPILASYFPHHCRQTLLNIILRCYSSTLLSEAEQHVLYDKLKETPDFPYLLILATIEPRKNHITLIRAWEQLRAKHEKNLKLIIAGGVGWQYEAILDVMRPHVKQGDIIHLEKIPPADMGCVYSQAKAFVFPSFSEGFGCPPLEAMQCGCPVVVSDIPTHRWVYGEAALYGNPYDVNTWIDRLTQLLYSEEAKALQATLREKGFAEIKRYSQSEVGEQWVDLLHRLKLSKKPGELMYE